MLHPLFLAPTSAIPPTGCLVLALLSGLSISASLTQFLRLASLTSRSHFFAPIGRSDPPQLSLSSVPHSDSYVDNHNDLAVSTYRIDHIVSHFIARTI